MWRWPALLAAVAVHGRVADARHTLEQGEAISPIVVAVDELKDLPLYLVKLLLKRVDHLPDAAGQGLVQRMFQAVVLHRDHLHELPPAGDQFIEHHLVLRGFFAGLRADDRAELREDAGVDGIGLGQLPAGRDLAAVRASTMNAGGTTGPIRLQHGITLKCAELTSIWPRRLAALGIRTGHGYHANFMRSGSIQHTS